LVGFPLIALIPALAMAGVFGERWATAEAAGTRVRARVEFPSRFRARVSKPMIVTIENRSAASIDTVDVVFDSAYVERFASINFVPEPRAAYVVSVTDVKPGEMRRVHLELEGDLVGRHTGRILVRTRDDSTALVVRTTVFP
jgi:hypothetical protein